VHGLGSDFGKVIIQNRDLRSSRILTISVTSPLQASIQISGKMKNRTVQHHKFVEVYVVLINIKKKASTLHKPTTILRHSKEIAAWI
jgi:hypothetical protein